MDEIPRIEIEENGPYVLIGEVPVMEMAPVLTFNGEPVDWHKLKDLPVRGGRLEFCRCGQSSNKPYCDATHEASPFDGTETASRTPYHERAAADRRGDIAIADDGPLCLQAGFCRTRTTTVWELLHHQSDPVQLERMLEMIGNCPGGRLTALDSSGHDIEPDLDQGIGVLPGGPLWVRGGITITSADGQSWENRNRVTLCRCGGSANKPFCDGAHASRHFDER